jgi:hypothetical protein
MGKTSHNLGGAKPGHEFYHAARKAVQHHKQLYGKDAVDTRTARSALKRASKRAGKDPRKQLVVQKSSIALRTRAAQRVDEWCDPSQTHAELEKKDEVEVRIDYAIVTAAARLGKDPTVAAQQFVVEAAAVAATKKQIKEGAEKKRQEGSTVVSTTTYVREDGTRSKYKQVQKRTAEEHVAWQKRAYELGQMDPKDRPMANSQQYAPGMTPLQDRSGRVIDAPKKKLPGTEENGVYQCKEGTFTVNKQYYTGPKQKPIYFKTRAEADAQRAEWIRKKWLPTPKPPPNAVSKSTSEATHAH